VAQSKREIQALLADANSQPRHRFGQNFMIDQNLVRLVAEAGEIAPGDLLIEVGPGTGTLTQELLARAGAVVTVEIDRDLASLLRQQFADDPKFELIEGDALKGKHDINPELAEHIRKSLAASQRVKLVANLPYNIASPLVIELLIAGVSLLAFTVQKEVADRLRAGAHDDAYGPLTVMAQMLGRVELLRTLPPQAFWPAPKIESALMRILREDRVGAERIRDFGEFVHKVFSFRRKTLRRALAQAGYNADLILAKTEIEGGVRPETLRPEQFLQMFEVNGSP
jgi:16S rRNA (adenine1518-N6/adenine1519-N6)-dimethyltransferase